VPIKPKSWRIIKKRGIFGVPKKALKVIRDVKVGDVFYFHVFKKPVNGVVGKARVVSELFEDNQNIWGKDLYPFRVRIEFINNNMSRKYSDKLKLYTKTLFS
jgi:predicted RNA-binding protein